MIYNNLMWYNDHIISCLNKIEHNLPMLYHTILGIILYHVVLHDMIYIPSHSTILYIEKKNMSDS